MKRIWILAVIVVALGVAGAYFLWQRPLTVAVVQPETNVQLRIYGLGTVEARVLSRVGFEVGAALTELKADAGQSVKKGQVLASLHQGEQEARIARARAAVASNAASMTRAEAALGRGRTVLAEKETANKRQQRLVKQDITSGQKAEEAQRDVDVAAADIAVAQAEIAVIRAQGADVAAALQLEKTLLAHHTLLAPYDAVIISRHAEAGTVIKAGDPIFTLIEPATIWIQAYIDEERAGQLSLGQPATIRLRSRPDIEIHGTVSRIGLESDRVNEERRVWLSCSDCPVPMYLGEQAEVRITTAQRDNAIMVPEIAIADFDGHRGNVWLLREGKLTKATMTFGARDDRGRVELAGTLPEGAMILAAPPQAASEGRSAKFENSP